MNEKIVFIRDASELSNQMEEYLNSIDVPFIAYYSDESENVPNIISQNSFSSFIGKRGFEIFKAIYSK
jgi:hypothetical protein